MWRAVALFCLIPFIAHAQYPACRPKPEVFSHLETKYHEVPQQMGLAAAGVVALHLSPKNETWTITLTTPDGLTCLLSAGEGWETIPFKKSEIAA